MPKSFDASLDRRQAPRTKLVEIAYIGMGPDNGGLVLDVSDGGLSFQAVSPVHPSQEIRFLLSLRGHSRIEGAGRVVWTNEMRTVCGLRFTSLSSGAREHLNNWTNQTRTPVSYRAEPGKMAATAKPQLSVASQSPPHANAVPVFTIPAAAESPLSLPETKSVWQKPVFIWILFAALASSLSVAAFQLGVRIGKSRAAYAPQQSPFHIERPENPSVPAPAPAPAPPNSSDANSVPGGMPSSPIKVSPGSGNAAPAPEAITPAPALVNSATRSALVNSAKSEVPTPAKSKSLSPKPGMDAIPGAASGKSVEAGNSQLKAAMAFLNGDNGRKDIPSALRLLWAAVANGNAEAEITLADLYASGDGIEKDCDQARTLLTAASKSGSVLAEEKLQDLNANGCQ